MKIYIVSWEVRSSYDRDSVVFKKMQDAVLHAGLIVAESYTHQKAWDNVRHRLGLLRPSIEGQDWYAAWQLFESFDDDCVTIEEKEVWEDEDEDSLKKQETIARLLTKM